MFNWSEHKKISRPPWGDRVVSAHIFRELCHSPFLYAYFDAQASAGGSYNGGTSILAPIIYSGTTSILRRYGGNI